MANPRGDPQAVLFRALRERIGFVGPFSCGLSGSGGII
jgi:hypothetical protein